MISYRLRLTEDSFEAATGTFEIPSEWNRVLYVITGELTLRRLSEETVVSSGQAP